MAKVRQVFVCRSCGGAQSRWLGKCPDCGAWDSLEQQRIDPAAAKDPQRGAVQAFAAWATVQEGAPEGDIGIATGAAAVPIVEVRPGEGVAGRIRTGIGELDRVLGGGLVAGSAVLVGGDPGIGKSTLMLQAAGRMAGGGRKSRSHGVTESRSEEEDDGHDAPSDGVPVAPSLRDSVTSSLRDSPPPRVLYVSSEESAEQVRMRAERLGVGDVPGLYVLADTNLARIIEQARRVEPQVLVIDSVQMVYKADLDASPGSVAQLRRVCAELVYLAKLSGIAIVLVGHVTKDGQLAGPRLLEHLVDAVLYFEGDRYHAHRVIRGVKNRFGTTLEIGIFEMTGEGLREIPEGAGVSVLEGAGDGRPGSVVCPVMTGARCLLVELQALTATGFLGAAKRKSSGLDANRLAMIIAVLEQHGGLRLADRDVFASSVGGIRVAEPASDLALALAIAGSHYKRGLPPGTAVVGEVGLGGEVRPVGHVEHRIKEAARLGFKRVIIPGRVAPKAGPGVEVLAVRTVSEAMSQIN